MAAWQAQQQRHVQRHLLPQPRRHVLLLRVRVNPSPEPIPHPSLLSPHRLVPVLLRPAILSCIKISVNSKVLRCRCSKGQHAVTQCRPSVRSVVELASCTHDALMLRLAAQDVPRLLERQLRFLPCSRRWLGIRPHRRQPICSAGLRQPALLPQPCVRVALRSASTQCAHATQAFAHTQRIITLTCAQQALHSCAKLIGILQLLTTESAADCSPVLLWTARVLYCDQVCG